MIEVPDWSAAACRDHDPELFFPISGNQDGPAKKVCDRCDLRQSCLDYAIDAGEKFGIWGGESPEERMAEVRRRNKAARDGAGRFQAVEAK